MRSYRMLGASLACFVAIEPAASAQTSSQLRPGTYALRLCRVTCNAQYPKNTFRTGWIVLATAPLNVANFPDSVRKVLELISHTLPRGLSNGCFHFTSNRAEIRTYADVAGVVHWQPNRSGHSVTFQLGHSDDTGHDVEVSVTPTGFAGRGHSWGAGVAAVDFPDDVVVGEYLGPPNVARCEEAGNAFLADMRAVARTTRAMPRPPCDSARAAQVALDSVNKRYDFRSSIYRFERSSGGGIRIVTAPDVSDVLDGMAVVRLDARCRIHRLVLTDSA